MSPLSRKPFVHMTIDAVDLVVHDPEGRYDPDHYDRYPTFEAARDAALSSVELMLDAGDYDGDDHRKELEQMLGILEPSETYDDLARQPAYRWYVDRLLPVGARAA